MTPNDIREELKAAPFGLVRLMISDGSHYDVHHPDLCLIGLASVVLGLPAEQGSPFFERTIRLDCRHITRIVPLLPNPAATNGEAGS